MLGLGRLGNHAYGTGGNVGFFADTFSEARLVAGPGRNFRVDRRTTRRNIDQVYAKGFETSRQLDGLIRVPAIFYPVRGRDPDKQRQFFRPHRTHGFSNLQHQANAVFK
ncbi:hypothetical protein D3C84_788530 [compost metagenome]